MNSFDSLDKLMELGLSMVVAQQMMGTMNHALNQMQTPGAGQPMQSHKQTFYAVIDSAQAGPFSEEEIGQLVAAGRLTGDTLVWNAGMPAWVYACEVPAVNKWIVLKSAK